MYFKGVGCSYARFNKKGGGGLEKPRNETNRENEIYLSGIVLHTHVGTIKHTSGGAPRVGGRVNPIPQKQALLSMRYKAL